MTEPIESTNIVSEPTPWTEVSDPAVLAKIPLVSAYMLTYNHAPYIAQAIEGVLRQETNFPIELVIGEDCSTDSTREIVLNYQQKYPTHIRVITSGKNVGANKNAHRVRKACRGKYIAFCEGDDYWHNSNKLQMQCDHLENHPECGLVFSSFDLYHVKNKKLIKDFIKYRKWHVPGNPDVYSFFENFIKFGGKRVEILTCTVMMRRKLWEHIVESDPYLHQSGHFMMGDTQIWVETAKIAGLHFIPESLATHVITEDSATRSKDIRKVLLFEISRAHLMIYLSKKYGLPNNVVEKYEKYKCDLSLRLAYYTRNSKLAEESIKQKYKLDWKEWLRYKGTKNFVYHEVYRALEKINRLLQKDNYNDWA